MHPSKPRTDATPTGVTQARAIALVSGVIAIALAITATRARFVDAPSASHTLPTDSTRLSATPVALHASGTIVDAAHVAEHNDATSAANAPVALEPVANSQFVASPVQIVARREAPPAAQSQHSSRNASRDRETPVTFAVLAGSPNTSAQVAPAAAQTPARNVVVPVRSANSARFPQPTTSSTPWREQLAASGITFDARAITDASHGSGVASGAHAARVHDIVTVRASLDSLVGWHGMTVVAQHKMRQGPNSSADGGFTQNFSNIDAPDFRAFGEVYAEQKLASDRVRIKAGRLDFNSEFAATDNSGAFLNASMGYSPSIVAAPTFPLPTGGVNVFVSPRAGVTVGAGVFNGLGGAPAPDGGSSRFYIAQANATWAVGAGALPGRVAVGAFHHTGMFLASEPQGEDQGPSVRGTGGWYSTLDQTLYKSAPSSAGAAKTVAAYAQLGQSSRDIAGVHEHVGAGTTFTGFVPVLPASMLGLGATHASWTGGRESIVELFYQAPVLSRLTLVADEQLVRRQGTLAARNNGHVFTLRTIVVY